MNSAAGYCPIAGTVRIRISIILAWSILWPLYYFILYKWRRETFKRRNDRGWSIEIVTWTLPKRAFNFKLSSFQNVLSSISAFCSALSIFFCQPASSRPSFCFCPLSFFVWAAARFVKGSRIMRSVRHPVIRNLWGKSLLSPELKQFQSSRQD